MRNKGKISGEKTEIYEKVSPRSRANIRNRELKFDQELKGRAKGDLGHRVVQVLGIRNEAEEPTQTGVLVQSYLLDILMDVRYSVQQA